MWVEHGKADELYADLALTPETMADRCETWLKTLKKN